MGRSPVFATTTCKVLRPALAITAPAASSKKYSPGFMLTPRKFLLNGIVNCHQLRAVRKRRLHLHLVNHLSDSVHHLLPRQNPSSKAHDVGHALAIPPRFLDLG